MCNTACHCLCLCVSFFCGFIPPVSLGRARGWQLRSLTMCSGAWSIRHKSLFPLLQAVPNIIGGLLCGGFVHIGSRLFRGSSLEGPLCRGACSYVEIHHISSVWVPIYRGPLVEGFLILRVAYIVVLLYIEELRHSKHWVMFCGRRGGTPCIVVRLYRGASI